MVTRLLDAGASPNLKTRSMGRIPLDHCATYGQAPTIALLLAHSADATARDSDGRTPLDAAIRPSQKGVYSALFNAPISHPKKRQAYQERALFAACDRDERELALLAIQAGVIDPVDPKTKETPLLVAITRGAIPTARLLIRHGARQDVKAKDSHKTPMLLAAELGHEVIVKELATRPKPKASDDPLGVNCANEKGETPLMLAVRGDHEKCVKVLLELGADREAENAFLETAVDIAEEKGVKEVMELLKG